MFVTSFTPGPNNITSASMGVLHGYRKTLPYLFGVVTGFFSVMLLCGLLSSVLAEYVPGFFAVFRYIGAVYILWLAYHTVRASYSFEVEGQKPLGYPNGLFLQLVNPKAIIYGVTLFTTFLSPLTERFLLILAAAGLLACFCFLAISTWALFGSGIRETLKEPRYRRIINWALALLLVYTALEISGLLG